MAALELKRPELKRPELKRPELKRPELKRLEPRRLPLAAALLCLLLVGCAHKPDTTLVSVPDWWDSSAKRPLNGTAVQRVTADAIYTIYSRNLFLGATPDQRFLDRLLLVSGVFNGFNSRHADRAYLELRTHEEGAFTYAVLDARAQPLMAALVPGQSVKLLCRGAGAVGGSPMLLGCRADVPTVKSK